MPEFTPVLLSHFGLYRFTGRHAELDRPARAQMHRDLLAGLRSAGAAVQAYQLYPAHADADILFWSSLPVEDSSVPARFFQKFAQATLPFRQWLAPVQSLWGFTRPSQYTKTRSTQEIDPLSRERKPYLVIYPFVKTTEWYLLSQEARQGMMNGHIKIGKQFPDITQLLLYSFGLQDQEFVVVYETDDLAQFSNLVYALRDSDARSYTLRDTPLFTAIYQPAEATLALWE